jgi:hypothetical protein
MIFLCFIQNLTIAGSKEDFKSVFPNKAFAIILDPYIQVEKRGFLFFQGFKYESISTPKINDKVGASGVLYLA